MNQDKGEKNNLIFYLLKKTILQSTPQYTYLKLFFLNLIVA